MTPGVLDYLVDTTQMGRRMPQVRKHNHRTFYGRSFSVNFVSREE